MIHTLDLTQPPPPIFSGHLKLGGINSQGDSIEFTNYYMLQNGKPCIPVMGEFHFSRYDNRFWEEELLKMKAGGIDIVATYIFWNHIEEDEGTFDWADNRNLRHFVELCIHCGLQVFVRIGPFAHGECRNGGLPDWLYGRPFLVRSNDSRYLGYVQRLYDQIAVQLDGLFFKDGGPIIGIQLDNEYMHCGAPWEVTHQPKMEWVPAGSDGVDHIQQLRQLALNAGLEAPIFSCTGWLNSPIIENEILPMQGGYAFTPWSPDPNYRQAPTQEFLFRNRHLDPILNGKPTYEAANYPYACCEIGGGIQITYFHRPIVPPESVEALAVMNLAGGANMIGYYMYHGGSHPVGKHSFMNEFTVPRISYDFQAPIQEFGQIADSYRYLRLIHQFLKDFGDLLAPMMVVLPDDISAITPENTASLRYAARYKDGVGFLFLNNYQDHVEMRDIPDIRFQLQMHEKILTLPHLQPLALGKNITAILPFGLSLNGILLNYATSQLFTKVEDDAIVIYCFFAVDGMLSEYAFNAATCGNLTVSNGEVKQSDNITYVTVTPGTDSFITMTNLQDKIVRVLTLTRKQAEQTCKHTLWGKEHLIISDANIVTIDDICYLYTIGVDKLDMSVYPPVERTLSTSFDVMYEQADGEFIRYSVTVPNNEIYFDIEMIGTDRAILKFPSDILDNVNDIVLRIDYVGDIGSAYIDGKLIHDNFYNGTIWEMGLRHFSPAIPEKELFILISPIVQNGSGVRYIPTSMAFRPDAKDDQLAEIHSITAVPEYKIRIEGKFE